MGSAVHILVVDDDPAQLRIREMLLRHAGFDLFTATSAESALVLLNESSSLIGAVVTDHVLPGFNGVELVRELRRKLPRIPVLVLTGMPAVETEYSGLDVRILTKPCRPTVLIDTLHQMLEPGRVEEHS
jgi:DNA-binding response OmpR family regulator